MGPHVHHPSPPGLDSLSTYGILRGESREFLVDVLEQLEDAGCIRQTGDRYPVVSLTVAPATATTSVGSVPTVSTAPGITPAVCGDSMSAYYS